MAHGTATTPTASDGYAIARSQGKCGITGRTIQPGEKMMAALRETPTGLERIDVAIEAWPQVDHSNLLGFWKTTRAAPDAKKKTFVDDAVLCDVFERLGETTELLKLQFRFVLGLILLRKRLLTHEATRATEGGEIWTVRLKGREQTLELIHPLLDERQAAEVGAQLGEILEQSL